MTAVKLLASLAAKPKTVRLRNNSYRKICNISKKDVY